MNAPVAIYRITNTVNGLFYIGQSVNPERRIRRHFWKNNGCIKLRNAVKKYGKDVFVSEILYWCSDKNDANEVEQLLIGLSDCQNNGYNICPGGNGTGAGANNPFYGKTHTKETVSKIVAANVGRKMPEHQKKIIAGANRNRVWSEGSKEKLRNRPKSELCSLRTAEANRARVWTDEAKAKLAAVQKGRKMPEEARAKIAEANRKRVWTEESRKKLAAAKSKQKVAV